MVRGGAAWGLAGATKGLGISCLTSQNVIDTLKAAANNRKDPNARQGALFAFECLCGCWEFYSNHLLLLCSRTCCSSLQTSSRMSERLLRTARIVMANLTTHGVKQVMPTLMKGFHASQWRTKRASIMMLGSMAFAAPKQLAACLPQIMPRLADSLKDAQPRVRDAGKEALDNVAAVIKNPEIQTLVPLLKRAMVKPSEGLGCTQCAQ